MRLDVVDQGRLGPAHGAAGMKAQELGPCLLPLARIAALAAVRAGSVIAALALKLALDLTLAKDAMRHNLAAGTEAGRTWHGVTRK